MQEMQLNLLLQAFDTLREINPKFAEKLSFVSCNLEADELGLAQKVQEMLQDEVDIFVHGAATLKFNEHLRYFYFGFPLHEIFQKLSFIFNLVPVLQD